MSKPFFNSERLLQSETYAPGKLLDAMIERGGLKNDAALSRAMNIQAPMISKVRNKKLPVSALFLIRLHETFDMPIAELRTLMGD